MIKVHKGPFKRSQLEEALAHAIHVQPPANDELKLDIKRLLDIDRAQPINSRAKKAEDNYHAFSYLPPVGTGNHVLYSGYDVFAVYVAIRLLRLGYPQRRAVSRMRGLRPTLEKVHRQILSVSPAELIDHKPNVDLETSTGHGTLVTKLDHMVCLVLGTGKYTGLNYKTQADRDSNISSNVCEGRNAIEHQLEFQLKNHEPSIVIELVNSAHQIAYWLARIEPTRRGR